MSARRTIPVLLTLALLAAPGVLLAKGPIKTLSLDPEAKVVELFSAAETGDLRVRFIAKGPREANVFIENTTASPLTVAVPPAITAVHVLKQIQPFPNQPPFGIVPNPNVLTQGNGQAVGGPLNPVNGQFPQGPALGDPLNPFPPGLNFFSIPPERSVWLKADTVCLDHGKPNPKPKMSYVVVPIERQIDDPVLRQVLADYDAETESRTALQAAAWHLSNGMTWDEVERLPVRRGNIVRAYFQKSDVDAARSLVQSARKKVEAAETGDETTAAATTRSKGDTSIE